jgi:hypothetical protein
MTDTSAPPAAPPEPQQQITLLPIPVYDDATLPANPPRFFVYQDALHASTIDDEKWVIPLRVKARIVAEIEHLDTSLDQLQALASIRGDEGLSDALDEMDIIDAREIARKFFQAFNEKEEARLGESFGSSAT